MFSKSTTEDREDVDGDRENLLESEIPPSEEFPESFPLSFRNLEADPFLRLQVDFRNLEADPFLRLQVDFRNLQADPFLRLKVDFRNLEADPFLRLQVDFRNLELYSSSGSR